MTGQTNENNYDRFFDGEDDEKRYYWHSTTIRGILRNPIYAGHLVMDKRPTLSFKSKKRLRVLPENYTIIPNTHESLVDPEDERLATTGVERRLHCRRKTTKQMEMLTSEKCAAD